MTILKAERGTRNGPWGLGEERRLLASWGWHRLRKTMGDGRAGVDVERAFWVEGAVWAEPRAAGGPAAWRAEQTKSPKGADGRSWVGCWEARRGCRQHGGRRRASRCGHRTRAAPGGRTRAPTPAPHSPASPSTGTHVGRCPSGTHHLPPAQESHGPPFLQGPHSPAVRTSPRRKTSAPLIKWG